MTNPVPSANGFVVVTHGSPQQGAQTFTQAQNVMLRQNGAVSPSSSRLERFLKGQPAALGAMQMMIGLVILLFGIVSVFHALSPSVISGIVYWGSIIYIITGSLTIQANKRLSACMVKASLGMSIISTITAATGIAMHSLDMALYWFPHFLCNSTNSDCYVAQEIYLNRIYGTAAVMIVLSLLQFIVSICVSAFACHATCSSDTAQVIYQVPPSYPATHFSSSPVNTPVMPYSQLSVFPRAQHNH